MGQSKRTETIIAEGGVRSGSSLVAEPGTGSLAVIGPTGEVVGAKSEDELGAVSGEAGPLSSGVGQMGCAGIGGEVNASELLSMMSSGNEWRRSAIKILVNVKNLYYRSYSRY